VPIDRSPAEPAVGRQPRALSARAGAGRLLLALGATVASAAAEPTTAPAVPSPAENDAPAMTADDAGEPEAKSDDDVSPTECAAGWERRAFKSAVRSVVRVQTPNGWGAGFFFENSTTVVTALHVVEHGRWVDVVDRDGETRRARVVHNGDQELDLAVLELESSFPNPMPPIPSSPYTPEVGMPVLMIGHPGTEAGGWSVSWGRVGSEQRDNGAIEVDGTVNPGNSGGPLLDCEGRVLGVVSYLKDTGITMAIPIGDLPRPGDRYFHSYRGAVATAGRLPNVVYSHERDLDLWGLGLGFDVVLKNRFTTAFQGHYQWRSANPSGAMIQSTDRRWQLEAFEEYRIFGLGALGFGLGAALSFDAHRALSGAIDVTDPANPTLAVDEQRKRSTRLRPMATVSWALKPLLLGYAYQLDTIRPEFSTHRVFVGLRMESVLSYE
jgi:hypothetical protein